jgi:hypothetical protein
MSARRRYRKKAGAFVVAVPLALETEGFVFRKWGAEQRCGAGDWIVENHGDVYTVKADVFARTYARVGPGHYVKTTPVWAEVAAEAGVVSTREGRSGYQAGDYLVFNDEEGTDRYCVDRARFEAMYEPDE